MHCHDGSGFLEKDAERPPPTPKNDLNQKPYFGGYEPIKTT